MTSVKITEFVMLTSPSKSRLRRQHIYSKFICSKITKVFEYFLIFELLPVSNEAFQDKSGTKSKWKLNCETAHKQFLKFLFYVDLLLCMLSEKYAFRYLPLYRV